MSCYRAQESRLQTVVVVAVVDGDDDAEMEAVEVERLKRG